MTAFLQAGDVRHTFLFCSIFEDMSRIFEVCIKDSKGFLKRKNDLLKNHHLGVPVVAQQKQT